ncbi:4-hydroxybenzoate polyprenyltransferase [Chryseobacterium bernardetii]|jgi:4-hydroxybenzoate polyprenyltransferase|uniref:4-hydroxybenzoate polyprenyltransferase n=3 Tax=Chryseobacterium TaxID=59732 RepID=A0A543EJZ3_9FLAO|nr:MULTISPECIES: UbiA family prenyltransferase [Chryseobacterium]MDR6370263.1 4-hydroxybenzoate polyprenyltransferase [Chryseobacterium vietnamense]MDR6440494.1 4-hydroxybenzoate polyprenyltransferase [Chryseobacterium bernardetii]MDR6458328.1 4-hydroxybenzoate polyprenyltransferase [Chryseobacterium vietnamense]MDR6486940.1 4-hydroxybenzoate polyprenyltransferase [Chryseobacterium vietnamense]TQM21877.1 4-hydroxybenzoate polyprenyltransferase [Chryseobacterium aquifrigidense]
MNSEKEPFQSKNYVSKSLFYRFSQFVGFLLGARFFVAALLTFALYVSTFFLFNQDESFRKFVFDFKVHGIIFCTVLTILAGGIINQFYDLEKDHLVKPFRTRLQRFIKQKYFLYAYLALSAISLGVAWMISHNVFVFFVVYQFFMWFYSHKLSRILILNNLTFVSLTLYPFFGMMVYYETFSKKVFLMAVFLFLILLCIDIVKDTLTRSVDKTFGYTTIPNYFKSRNTKIILTSLLIVTMVVSMKIITKTGITGFMAYYFAGGLFVMIVCIYLLLNASRRSNLFTLNILRFWVFIGIIAMLLNGIEHKL